LAKNFGHIYAAGIQAVRFGTVPWSEDLVLKCVRRCYRDARRELEIEGDLLRRALRRLRSRTVNDENIAPADGHRQKQIGRTRITVRPEAFKAWFDDPRQPKLALEWLKSKNALPNRPTPTKRGNDIVWAESQPQWPDGVRRRSIVIDVSGNLFKGL
jgi:hypothetical protein